MTAAEPQEDEMTERPSDIERAARVADACADERQGNLARCKKAGGAYDVLYGKMTEAERIAERIRALAPDPVAEENKRLIAALAECFRLSGAEPGSDDEWTLAARAVDAVRRLREDYDEVDPIAEAERRRLREAVDSLHSAMCFAVDDWSGSKACAWIYGLVVGWDEALGEVAQQFGWSDEDVGRLRTLHAALRRAREVDRG